MGRVSDRRRARVQSLIQRTLDDLIRNELKDPRIGVFSITEVKLAGDIGYADVSVSVVGGDEQLAGTIEVFNRAAPLLRNRLRVETDLRTVPRLRFKPDQGIRYLGEIDELLRKLPQPAAQGEGAGSGAGADAVGDGGDEEE